MDCMWLITVLIKFNNTADNILYCYWFSMVLQQFTSLTDQINEKLTTKANIIDLFLDHIKINALFEQFINASKCRKTKIIDVPCILFPGTWSE